MLLNMMKIINVVAFANGLESILKCKHFSSQSRTELSNEEQGARSRHIALRHAGIGGSFQPAYCRLGKESNELSAVHSG